MKGDSLQAIKQVPTAKVGETLNVKRGTNLFEQTPPVRWTVSFSAF